MNTVIKARWFILLVWVALLVALLATAPNMANLVREKGQITVPDGYSSSIASDILNRTKGAGSSDLSIVLVFHHQQGIGQKETSEIDAALQKLEADKGKLGISGITSYLTDEQLKEQLVSKDHTTILTLLSVEPQNRDISEIRYQLNKELSDVTIEHYLTGSSLIDEDVVLSSEKGLKRTELITLIFILLVLLLVFRSAIAPLIPLITVGITYMASQSIVSYLVDMMDFPISSFTQIFLVAVLFGIGTDYCILLLSRFKEELSHHENVAQAILTTYRTAGKTVVFSALAAFVGFGSIGLASFKLYQSAAAVAVGVAVLIVALLTIVPFFMAVLGRRLFWPAKGTLEHKQSKLWAWAGNFSLTKPWYALLFVAVIVVPLLFSYSGKLSFDSLNEIGDGYDSVKAFHVIADSFSPGEALPAKIVLEHGKPMDNQQSLAMIEKISREVAKIPNVAKVRSATRPLGEELNDFSVSSQADTLDQGLGKGSDGIEQIRQGLSKAADNLAKSNPQLDSASAELGELTAGTEKLKTGVVQLQEGLGRIEQGIRSGAMGAGDLKLALNNAKANAQKLAASGKQLLAGYEKMAAGLSQIDDQYEKVHGSLNDISKSLSGLDANFSSLLQRHPELKTDSDFLTIQGTVQKSSQELSGMLSGLQALNQQLAVVKTNMDNANQGMRQAVSGQNALTAGLAQIETGLGQLQSGIAAAADGQNKAVAKLPQMANGLEQIAGGQQEAQQGFKEMSAKLNELKNGLTSSAEGLTQVSGGIQSARDYLAGLSSSTGQEMTGWYVPGQALNDSDFQKIFDNYMSADRKVATFDVVFKVNPYSSGALDTVESVKAAVSRAMQGTEFEGDTFGINGVSGIYADLQSISHKDYTRTAILMLIGITLILILLLRSLVMPLYLVASLVLCYFTSMAITELVFVKILHYSGINWTIPFFGFVILMALGVDYSIFLMARFNEHRGDSVASALLMAMKNMGTVIISAVIILAGTFAAMYPSGVLSLLQIATVVLSGLLLYAFLFLPFLIPVVVNMFGQANWWPFAHHKRLSAAPLSEERKN